jgi:hypothetical protein
VLSYPRAGESGRDMIAVTGVETIDASAVDTGFLGHSYYDDNRSVISDIFYLIRAIPPNQRECLNAEEKSGVTYWKFKRDCR